MSLAPSISNAFSINNAINFTQVICTNNGEKISIKVTTTKGKVITTELGTKEVDKPTPSDIQHQFQHCPFCGNPSVNVAIQVPFVPIVTFLSTLTERRSALTPTVLSTFYSLSPPAQAPPIL